MKILITGGAGFIGSVLVPQLLSNNFFVRVVDNFIFNQNSLLDCCKFNNFEIIKGDCRDITLMKSVLKDIDLIIPLAAIVGAPMCDADKTAALSVNLDAIKLLKSLCSISQKIIMPVSNSGYGIGEKDKFCDENSPLKPLSIYGISKVQAEEIILSRENSLTFRLATVFGISPRMRTDLLVNDFVYRAVYDKSIIIFEGSFKRNFIHVLDVANAFMHAIANFETMKGQAYNVGLDDANLTKIQLAEKIQEYIPDFVFFESKIGHDPDKRDYIVSNKKILNTGFRTKWNLEMGIKELIKGYTIIKNKQYANV